MIISHTLKVIFIHVHRTGGTSISNIFRQKAFKGLEEIAPHGNFRSREKGVFEQYSGYYTFGFVRNPWDRLLSWYALSLKAKNRPVNKNSEAFDQYLESLLIQGIGLDEYFHANQLDFFSDETGKVMIDRIGRYENYEKEVLDIMHEIGLSVDKIPFVNQTHDRDYTKFYSQKGIQLVEEYCKKDIEYLGYRFGG